MSRGQNLQEMEVGTAQSKTAVNANAKAGMPMDTSVAGSVEDLGGPTPDNYKPDNDSAKLREPKVATVKDIVNRGAKAAMAPETSATPVSVPEEVEETQEVIAEEEVETSAEYDIEEDMNALFSGEELTEEFQEKAKTIFEAAISAKVAQVAQEMEAKNEERIVEEIETVKSALIERVDSYLEYVADEWLQENELAVEHGLKSEMTESFLSGMKELFEAHYVSIPEDKYDVLESMVEKLDEMETKLNEQIEKNIVLNKRLSESVADGIFDDVAEGLALSQKEKLASLAESVEFESEEEYREKLETLKESYFPSRAVSPSARTESLSEGVDNAPESISGPMSAYLKTLSAFGK